MANKLLNRLKPNNYKFQNTKSDTRALLQDIDKRVSRIEETIKQLLEEKKNAR